ncbi:hypothetical protein V8F06_005154 [Rhypophila decipiens]
MATTRKARSSASETKLRASCDRCHELKNRCARGDTTDSRCERCERLDIDCVYSGVSRMGRPPGGQKSTINGRDKPENNSSRPHKRQAHSIGGHSHHVPDDMDFGMNGMRTSGPGSSRHRPNRPSADNNVSNNSSSMASSPAQQEMASTGDQFEGQAVSDQATFTSSPGQLGSQFWLDEAMSGQEDMIPLYEWLLPGSGLMLNGNDFGILQGSDPKLPNVGTLTPASFTAPGEYSGDSNGNSGGIDIATQEKLLLLQDGLLKLQTKLGNLASRGVSGQNQHFGQNHVPDDEILASTQALLDITRALVQLGMPRALLDTGRAKGPKAIQSFPYPVLRTASTASCHVTILQLLTCYAYVLQILDPFVARLATQLETPPSVQNAAQYAQPDSRRATASLSTPSSLSRSTPDTTNSRTSSGSSSEARTSRSPVFPDGPTTHPLGGSTAFTVGRFSFASQPALNADLLLRAVIQMIGEIHTKTNLLALGDAGVDVDQQPQLQSCLGGQAGSGDDTFFLGPAASSPVILSAHAVMAVVHAKKRDLSQRMRDLTQE